jgi:hypothetical protein
VPEEASKLARYTYRWSRDVDDTDVTRFPGVKHRTPPFSERFGIAGRWASGIRVTTDLS